MNPLTMKMRDRGNHCRIGFGTSCVLFSPLDELFAAVKAKYPDDPLEEE
jgi:hypothetical protein